MIRYHITPHRLDGLIVAAVAAAFGATWWGLRQLALVALAVAVTAAVFKPYFEPDEEETA